MLTIDSYHGKNICLPNNISTPKFLKPWWSRCCAGSKMFFSSFFNDRWPPNTAHLWAHERWHHVMIEIAERTSDDAWSHGRRQWRNEQEMAARPELRRSSAERCRYESGSRIIDRSRCGPDRSKMILWDDHMTILLAPMVFIVFQISLACTSGGYGLV
jgi:hypothetical protein